MKWKYNMVLHRPKLLKKCQRITGFKYDYCFSRGHYHEAMCFNVEEGICHLVQFTRGTFEESHVFTSDEIRNREFVSE